MVLALGVLAEDHGLGGQLTNGCSARAPKDPSARTDLRFTASADLKQMSMGADARRGLGRFARSQRPAAAGRIVHKELSQTEDNRPVRQKWSV
jgi:hypothetical protein